MSEHAFKRIGRDIREGRIGSLVLLYGKEQYLVPYLMSSHPGCTMQEAVRLAEYLRDINHEPEQVQDFYPTPSTLSTVMYDTGLDPRTMEPVYVPKNPHEKAMQRALIQYKNPKNYDLVKEALIKAGREDLIGFDEKCLIRPRKEKWREEAWEKKNAKNGKSSKTGQNSGKNSGKRKNGESGKGSISKLNKNDVISGVEKSGFRLLIFDIAKKYKGCSRKMGFMQFVQKKFCDKSRH